MCFEKYIWNFLVLNRRMRLTYQAAKKYNDTSLTFTTIICILSYQGIIKKSIHRVCFAKLGKQFAKHKEVPTSNKLK